MCPRENTGREKYGWRIWNALKKRTFIYKQGKRRTEKIHETKDNYKEMMQEKKRKRNKQKCDKRKTPIRDMRLSIFIGM